jgi:hypothetical protein
MSYVLQLDCPHNTTHLQRQIALMGKGERGNPPEKTRLAAVTPNPSRIPVLPLAPARKKMEREGKRAEAGHVDELDAAGILEYVW